MIEILFTESAAGSMKFAKGLKSIAAEAFGIILETEDGHEPTPEEIEQVRAKMERERQKKRENAVQMEGSAHDVVCFPLNLSMGDISDPFSDKRAENLQSTVLIGGPDFSRIGQELMNTARRSLKKLHTAGEPVRIWYSHNPDELCGLCHILTCLPENADIRVVELPEYEVREGELRTYSGWGEIDPYDFGRFQALERPLTMEERWHFVNLWRELQSENGTLRAVVNGRLITVGADFYDYILLRQLDRQPPKFHEGRLIGEILGRYPLGLSDTLIALRIEDFISRGTLTPVTEPDINHPIYHRYLRKLEP